MFVPPNPDPNLSPRQSPPLSTTTLTLDPLVHLQVPMFASCDDGFIKSLVQTLKPQVLLRGDCAFKAYETATTMYVIQNGCVQIVNHAQNVVHITLFSDGESGGGADGGGGLDAAEAAVRLALRLLEENPTITKDPQLKTRPHQVMQHIRQLRAQAHGTGDV